MLIATQLGVNLVFAWVLSRYSHGVSVGGQRYWVEFLQLIKDFKVQMVLAIVILIALTVAGYIFASSKEAFAQSSQIRSAITASNDVLVVTSGSRKLDVPKDRKCDAVYLINLHLRCPDGEKIIITKKQGWPIQSCNYPEDNEIRVFRKDGNPTTTGIVFLVDEIQPLSTRISPISTWIKKGTLIKDDWDIKNMNRTESVTDQSYAIENYLRTKYPKPLRSRMSILERKTHLFGDIVEYNSLDYVASAMGGENREKLRVPNLPLLIELHSWQIFTLSLDHAKEQILTLEIGYQFLLKDEDKWLDKENNLELQEITNVGENQWKMIYNTPKNSDTKINGNTQSYFATHYEVIVDLSLKKVISASKY
jgi:hypothetical protein